MMQVKRIMGKHYKECILVIGVCSVLAFYITWCLSTIAYKGRMFEVLHLVGTLVTIFFYIGCVAAFQTYWGAPHLRKQLQLLNACVLVAFALVFLSDMGIRSLWQLLPDGIWIAAALFGWRILKCRLNEAVEVLWLWIKENYSLVIMLAAVCVLGSFPTMLQFRWDGALYEQACRGMSIHSMSSLGAYAHLAQGYGVLFCLVNVLVRETDCAMAVTNMVMYLASIMAFWGTMRQIVPGKRNWSYLLVTVIYACSPYTLGMVNYYSLDFATLCLFVCMLYFWVRREWVLQFVAALFACFTKEPAIISYGALCVGMVFVDLAGHNGGKITACVGGLLKKHYYYPMLLTGVLWVVTYLMLGGWSAGNGGAALDAVYMADKLKVLYVLNFAWIFVGIMVWGGICLLRKRAVLADAGWWLVPLGVSTAGFTLFSVVFRTVNHARYAAQLPSVLYMVGGYFLLVLLSERAAGAVAGLLACLMLASSYRTIDPVSRLCFDVLDTGQGQMVTTGVQAPGDSMIYNKQMLDMEYAVNEAVAYAVDNDCMVIMPMYGTSPNLFDGLMQEMEEQEYGCSALTYWSAEDGKRANYEEPGNVPFVTYEWSDAADITQLPLQDNDRHCFIYSPLLGEDRARQIQERYEDVEYQEYRHGVWTVSMLVF